MSNEAEGVEQHRHGTRFLDDLAAAWPDLGGVCGYCQRHVTNADKDGIHRVTPITKGGRGVECKLRGDW